MSRINSFIAGMVKNYSNNTLEYKGVRSRKGFCSSDMDGDLKRFVLYMTLCFAAMLFEDSLSSFAANIGDATNQTLNSGVSWLKNFIDGNFTKGIYIAIFILGMYKMAQNFEAAKSIFGLMAFAVGSFETAKYALLAAVPIV